MRDGGGGSRGFRVEDVVFLLEDYNGESILARVSFFYWSVFLEVEEEKKQKLTLDLKTSPAVLEFHHSSHPGLKGTESQP